MRHRATANRPTGRADNRCGVKQSQESARQNLTTGWDRYAPEPRAGGFWAWAVRLMNPSNRRCCPRQCGTGCPKGTWSASSATPATVWLSTSEMDRRTARWLDQERIGLPASELARPASGCSRAQARVPGAEPVADGRAERQLSEVSRLREADWSPPHGGSLEGAVEHAGAPSRRGLGGAVHSTASSLRGRSRADC